MEVSIATVGIGWEAAALKRKGRGRALPVFKPGGGDTRSGGGGVIFTVGELEIVTARLPLRTELLFPPLRQDTTESDFGRSGVGTGVVVVETIRQRAAEDVPPLITVVWPGVGGGVAHLHPLQTCPMK